MLFYLDFMWKFKYNMLKLVQGPEQTQENNMRPWGGTLPLPGVKH